MFQLFKIKRNDYYVLVSIGEENLSGEYFTQSIINYVMEELKKDNRFKNIDFNNKDDKTIKVLDKIIRKAEEVKIELSYSLKSSFYINGLYNDNELDLEITREKYEELCMDLWEKCLIKIDEALKLANLEKKNKWNNISRLLHKNTKNKKNDTRIF